MSRRFWQSVWVVFSLAHSTTPASYFCLFFLVCMVVPLLVCWIFFQSCDLWIVPRPGGAEPSLTKEVASGTPDASLHNPSATRICFCFPPESIWLEPGSPKRKVFYFSWGHTRSLLYSLNPTITDYCEPFLANRNVVSITRKAAKISRTISTNLKFGEGAKHAVHKYIGRFGVLPTEIKPLVGTSITSFILETRSVLVWGLNYRSGV